MTNEEICTKAVAAYHLANPDIVVDKWECAPGTEGVVILSIGTRKVYICHSDANGFEMIKQSDIHLLGEHNETVTAEQKETFDMPEFVPWKQLDESGTGALPVFLDIIAYVILFGSFFGMLFSPIVIVGGIGLFIGIASAAAMVKSARATSAKAAYAAQLLEYIAKTKE